MISYQFLSVLKQLLNAGYSSTVNTYYYYGSGGTITYKYPTNITVVIENNGSVVYQGNMSYSNVKLSDNSLSVTLTAEITQSISGNAIYVYASYNGTLIYAMSQFTDVSVSASSDSPLYVEYTLTLSFSNFSYILQLYSNNTGISCNGLKCCTALSNVNVVSYPLIYALVIVLIFPNIAEYMYQYYPAIANDIQLSAIPAVLNENTIQGITLLTPLSSSNEVVKCVSGTPSIDGVNFIVFYTNNDLEGGSIMNLVAWYYISGVYIPILAISNNLNIQAGNIYNVVCEINIQSD